MTRPTNLGRGGWPITSNLGGDVGVPGGSDPAPDCCDVGETPPDRATGDGANAQMPGSAFGDTENLLLGETVAGSSNGGVPTPTNPTNINDDNTSTESTVAAGVYGAGQAFWTVDLGAAALVSSTELWIAVGTPVGMTMEWSTDNSSWTEVVDTGDWVDSNPEYIATFADTEARYWRLVYNHGGGFGGTNNMGEWRLFGSPLTSDGVWVPAPEAVDADDATYELIPETGTSTDVLRVDLGAEFRIVTTRLVIGTQNAGSKTYTIKAANIADYSDEVVIATLSWSAVGSYAAQTIEETWYTTESYRYWELSGNDESRRVYSWELREATGSTNHQHTLFSLSDVSGTPTTADVLSYSSNTQLWQPRSAVLNITSNASNTLTNPFINLVSGSGIAFAAASNTLTIINSAQGGGGSPSLSYGSNASRVSEVSTAGSESAVARADHIHDGIGTVTASSSNTLQRGTVNFRPGTGIALALTDTDGDAEFDTITIVNTVGAGGGGGGGAPTTAKYVTTAADGTLSAEVVRPQLGNYFNETYPASPNSTYDDEFDDTTGMSGTNNGLDARWNWRNQGSTTTTFGKAGWLTIDMAAESSPNYRIIEISAFADGTYEALISVECWQVSGDGGGGIVLVDSTNGDLYVFVLVDVSGTSGLYLQRWNSTSSFNSTVASIGTLMTTNVYLRIVKSGTTIDAWWSVDGIGWRRLSTFTDAVSADRIGLGVYETKNSGATNMHVDYFRKTA